MRTRPRERPRGRRDKAVGGWRRGTATADMTRRRPREDTVTLAAAARMALGDASADGGVASVDVAAPTAAGMSLQTRPHGQGGGLGAAAAEDFAKRLGMGGGGRRPPLRTRPRRWPQEEFVSVDIRLCATSPDKATGRSRRTLPPRTWSCQHHGGGGRRRDPMSVASNRRCAIAATIRAPLLETPLAPRRTMPSTENIFRRGSAPSRIAASAALSPSLRPRSANVSSACPVGGGGRGREGHGGRRKKTHRKRQGEQRKGGGDAGRRRRRRRLDARLRRRTPPAGPRREIMVSPQTENRLVKTNRINL